MSKFLSLLLIVFLLYYGALLMFKHGRKLKEVSASFKLLRKGNVQVVHLHKEALEEVRIQRMIGELEKVQRKVDFVSTQLQDEVGKSRDLPAQLTLKVNPNKMLPPW